MNCTVAGRTYGITLCSNPFPPSPLPAKQKWEAGGSGEIFRSGTNRWLWGRDFEFISLLCYVFAVPIRIPVLGEFCGIYVSYPRKRASQSPRWLPAWAWLGKKHFEAEDSQFPLTRAKGVKGPSSHALLPIITPQFCQTHNFTIPYGTAIQELIDNVCD